MTNKESLEKLINEVLKVEESVLLAKPEAKKVIKEEKAPEPSEDS
jgi:hypothetical protein